MSWIEYYVRSKLSRSSLPAGLALLAAYVVAGRFGLLLAVPPGYATAIFPPAGIAMAAMFFGGRVTLPWTFLGSFLLNLWAGHTAYHRIDALIVAVALVIASASMLQAAIGGWALRRLIGYPASLDNGRDLARFFLSSPVLCLTSATLSLSSIAALGAIDTSDFVTDWLTWWIGDTLGVLLLLPLIMIAAGEPRALWRSRALPVAVPLLLFFALFVAIFMRVSAWENEQSLVEFRMLSQQVLDRPQARLGAQQVFLEQLNRSFAGPARLSRDDFHSLVQDLLLRFPVIQAVEWAPRVEAAYRAEFEAAQRRDLPGFEFREGDELGQLRRAGGRREFYPVTYLEPLHGNEPAVGFDLASEPNRGAAIVRAIATEGVIATAPIRLVQATGEQSGMLLTSAVPGGKNGPGVLLIVLRMGTFMETLLESASQSINIQFVDLDQDAPLFDTLSGSARNPLYQQTFGVAGRRYAVTAPSHLYLAQHRSWQSLAVLMAGVLSTSLLGALLMLGTGERHRFARLLAERTRERDRIWQVFEDLLGVGNFEDYFVSTNPAWTLHASEQGRADVAAARAQWRSNQPRLNARQLVFIDETWAATNMARRYGHAPRGQRVIAGVPHGHWKTSTFLAALRRDRITAPCVIDGAINGETFRAYIEQFLAPTLEPGDLVVMDNLAAHKVAGVREAIVARGASLLYLPPYSPDLNPIEQVFAKLKALLRTAAARTLEALWAALGQALKHFSPAECANYFANAGYVLPNRDGL